MATVIADCSRCSSPLERGDLRCAICGVAAASATMERAQVEAQIHRCHGCGAAVVYDPESRAPSCAFCGSVLEVETIDDPMEQTGAWVPFTVDRAAARRSLSAWLGRRGWLRPSDLAVSAAVEKLRPLWWAAWVFDAEALVSWTVDTERGSGQSAWAPHAGQTGMTFDDIVVSASRGLSAQETKTLVPRYSLSSAGSAPDSATEATIEQFDVQRSGARRTVIDAIHRLAGRRLEAGHLPGDRSRNLQVACLLRRLETRRIGLPAWVFAYRYRDRLYRAVICGQDADCVIGEVPRSAARIAVLVAVVLALVALFALLAL